MAIAERRRKMRGEMGEVTAAPGSVVGDRPASAPAGTIGRRFVLTSRQAKRLLGSLSKPPAPLSEEAKTTIAEARRVPVELDV